MAYTGEQITIPLGQLGLLTDLPPADIPPNALIEAKNISIEKGLVEKAPGALRYNATPLGAGIVGAIQYRPEPVLTRYLAATSDGKIYRDIGDRTFQLGVAIETGLGTLNPNCMFVVGGQETVSAPKKVFFFSDGLKQIKVLEDDAEVFEDIDAPAADWTTTKFPKVGLIHRSRLWVFFGQFGYASDTGDHENFTSNFLFNPIYPGEGGEIIGTFVFKGRLFVFKDGGFVYFLDDSDTSSANWVWKKLASNFGLSGPHAVLDALDDMIAGNTSGSITSYTATDALGDVESADILRNAQMENWARKNTDKIGLREQHALYYAQKKLAYFTFRSSSQTSNDMLLVLDANKPNLRVSALRKGTPQCLSLYKDGQGIEKPMYGDASGYLNLMDYEDRLEGGTAFEGSFQTPHLDFRFAEPTLAHKQKHFDFLAVEFVQEGNWNVTCDTYIDGKYYETVNFEQQIDDNYLGLFLLGTDRLAQDNTFTVTRPLTGTGRRISFKFYNSGSNQSFQIASITVGLRASGEQATTL